MTIQRLFVALAAVSMTALAFPSVVTQAQQGLEPTQPNDIRLAAATAATDWSKTRNCALLANVDQVVGNKMTQLAPAFAGHFSKNKLPLGQQNALVMGFTAVYLDSLSTQNGARPRVSPCSVSMEAVQSMQFPSIFSEPDSGVLEIDGSQANADIYIDNVKKGSIRQSFAVSAGKHRWRTMKCDEEVQIGPDETKKVYCSRSQ